MSLEQLRYFVTVADAGTTHEAARRLHISQPPLSRHIRALEEEIGVPLFARSARGMELLPSGELFLGRARAILEALDEAVTATRRSDHRRDGETPSTERSPARGR